jgi:hypothetical protein
VCPTKQADNARLDAHGFTPVGWVVGGGMDSVVDNFYQGYGEMSDLNHTGGVNSSRLSSEGNAYLGAEFGQLSRIVGASVVVSGRPTLDTVVKLSGVLGHLTELQRIASELGGGNRDIAGPGFNASR